MLWIQGESLGFLLPQTSDKQKAVWNEEFAKNVSRTESGNRLWIHYLSIPGTGLDDL